MCWPNPSFTVRRSPFAVRRAPGAGSEFEVRSSGFGVHGLLFCTLSPLLRYAVTPKRPSDF
jgi:hypothetical protein